MKFNKGGVNRLALMMMLMIVSQLGDQTATKKTVKEPNIKKRQFQVIYDRSMYISLGQADRSFNTPHKSLFPEPIWPLDSKKLI